MNRFNVGASLDFKHMLHDIGIIAVSLVGSMVIYHNQMDLHKICGILILVFIFSIIYLISNKEERVYNVTMFYYTDRAVRLITKSYFLAGLATGLVMYFVGEYDVCRHAYLAFLVFVYVLLVLNIIFIRPNLERNYNSKSMPRTAFIGKKDYFNKFFYFLNKTSIVYKNIGFVSMDSDYDEADYIGSVDNLEKIIREHNIDQLYIIQKRETDLSKVQEIADLCIEMGVTIRIVVDIYKRRKAFSYVSTVGSYPIVTYHTVSLNSFDRFVKRVFDIIGSSIGIILSSPIMLVAAIAVKCSSPGPILFKQVRVGQNGRQFKMWKFRSMYEDAEERKTELMAQNEIDGGVMFKMKDDPRITKVGKFIRKTSIDELPQFFNIFLGSMSLVGTRPPTLDEVEKYERDQWRRISIKPGLTGMWQVSGRSNIKSFEDIVALDVEYIDNWSLFMDIKIILKTVWVLIKKNDAY